jgi:hypothetical protein
VGGNYLGWEAFGDFKDEGRKRLIDRMTESGKGRAGTMVVGGQAKAWNGYCRD